MPCAQYIIGIRKGIDDMGYIGTHREHMHAYIQQARGHKPEVSMLPAMDACMVLTCC
jgi:hypothetical protein